MSAQQVQQVQRGINIPSFDGWKIVPIDNFGNNVVKHRFNLDNFFDDNSLKISKILATEQMPIETTEVANESRTRGYVFIQTAGYAKNTDYYLSAFSNIKDNYKRSNAVIQREFIHHDLHRAGFLWEAWQASVAGTSKNSSEVCR